MQETEAQTEPRTRRGLEKTLFQITVVLSTVFLIICMLSVITNR